MKKIAILPLLIVICFVGTCRAVAQIYVADYDAGNGTVKTALSNGTVTTYSATFTGRVNGIAFGPDSYLYAANTDLNSILKIASNGSVSTFVSGGLLSNPSGAVFDELGNLYIANYAFPSGASVIKITSAGVMTTYSNSSIGSGGGGLVMDTAGTLYASSNATGEVYKIATNGDVGVFATGFQYPTGLAFSPTSDLYVANQGAGGTIPSISLVSPSGAVSLFVDIGLTGFVNGLTTDSQGNIYATDGQTIKKITPDRIVSTYASGLNSPTGLATVPEPSTYALLILSGAASLYALGRRKSLK